jgi:NADH dehydrogenase/NADH:ubiquinone oxidoreductase subunit G
MVNLTINDRQVKGSVGSTIMEVARQEGIDIPQLCYHDAISPGGECRLCSVEIFTGAQSRIVASCLYPIRDGLVVKTNTERVVNLRRMLAELLLARCPNVKVVQDMARKLGVKGTGFKLEDKDEDCVLCGRCVRVCEEIVGVSAISLVNRGTRREVATPFYETESRCIGCGSCARVCPTAAVKVEDVGDRRIIRKWKTDLKLRKCKSCGTHFATEAQIEYLARKLDLGEEVFETCTNCRPGQA